MRYIGSKVSTRESIYDIIAQDIPSGTFCDPFGGIATMSSYFKERNFKVFTSDILTFANYFQTAKLQFNKYPKFKKLFKALNVEKHTELLIYINELSLENGWLVKEFSIDRQFFTHENACKINAISIKIRDWYECDLISKKEKAFLLASLIDSMDRVANTAGTYYAHLKNWTRKALKPFEYKFIEPVKGRFKGKSYQMDALELVKQQEYDVVYLDPPYNERSYARYYHLPEVIARQVEPKVNGKAGIPEIELQKSNYNSKLKALESFKELILNINCKILLFHYTDDGLINKDDVISILEKYGNISEFYINCLGYSTKQDKKNDKHHIYVVKRK